MVSRAFSPSLKQGMRIDTSGLPFSSGGEHHRPTPNVFLDGTRNRPPRYPNTGHKEWIEEDKIQQHVASKEQDHARRDTQHQA